MKNSDGPVDHGDIVDEERLAGRPGVVKRFRVFDVSRPIAYQQVNIVEWPPTRCCSPAGELDGAAVDSYKQ